MLPALWEAYKMDASWTVIHDRFYNLCDIVYLFPHWFKTFHSIVGIYWSYFGSWMNLKKNLSLAHFYFIMTVGAVRARRYRVYTTFNNISAITWRSVLLVEETGENHRPVASHWQTLLHTCIVASLWPL